MEVKIYTSKLKIILCIVAICLFQTRNTEDIIETEAGTQVIDEQSESGCKNILQLIDISA
jgi:hypothetical protein